MRIAPSVVKGIFDLLGKILAVLGIYRAGHRAGSDKAIIKSHNDAKKLRARADAIDAEIISATDADLRERLFAGADPD